MSAVRSAERRGASSLTIGLRIPVRTDITRTTGKLRSWDAFRRHPALSLSLRDRAGGHLSFHFLLGTIGPPFGGFDSLSMAASLD